MAAWRMAFRAGKNGHEMWRDCYRLGVAATEYSSVDNIDLSRHAVGEPIAAWSELAPSQKASLRRVVYEMQEGDLIYVKEGPMIVGKGVVIGPYQFDMKNRIQAPDGAYWQHQRPVKWVSDFPKIRKRLGRNQQLVVERLSNDDVLQIEQDIGGFQFPEEVPVGTAYIEGTVQQILVNRYERDLGAREQCKQHYGTKCVICGFDFVTLYGEAMDGFIHVHHLKQLSSIGAAHEVDPVRDLRPVCPNCHAVLHRREPPYSLDEVKKFIRARGEK